METTTYESPYPSGLYEPNIQAERRLDSPLTVASARAYNRHDVEIRRIEEVLGIPTGTGLPSGTVMERVEVLEEIVNPSGIVHALVGPFHTGLGDGIPISPDAGGNTTVGGHAGDSTLHYPKQYGNTLPFHDDMGNANYAYIQWLLEWLGMWDTLSAGGTTTPSIIEIVKALWQNKYDLEVMFEPVWLSEAAAFDNTTLPETRVFKYTALGGEKFWAGAVDDDDGCSPIGGAGDLNNRPWPIYRAYCMTCGTRLTGAVELEIGHEIWFFSWAATELDRLALSLVDLLEDHWIGLFQKPAHAYHSQPTGPGTSAMADSFPTYSGLPDPIPVPPPIIPIPGSGAKPLPTGLRAYKGPVRWDWDSHFQITFTSYSGHLDGDGGSIRIAPGDVTASKPQPLTNNPLSWVNVPGSWQYGGDMNVDAFQAYIATHVGWNLIYIQVVAPTELPGWKPTNLHCYVNRMPYDGFDSMIGTPWPPDEYDFPFTPPVGGYIPSQIYSIPVGYIYTEPGQEGVVLITISDEGRTPGPITDQYYILSISTYFVSSIVAGREIE